MTARSKLREALSEELVPVLLQSGFGGAATIAGNSLCHEYRRSTPSWERIVLRRTDTLEREAVRLCLACLPEVEAWWNTQAPSRHITSWPVTYRRTSARGGA